MTRTGSTYRAPPQAPALPVALLRCLPLLALLLAGPPAGLSAQAEAAIPFTRHEIDAEHLGIRKVGDIDGDGYPDIVARNELGSELPVIVWYRYPDWSRRVLGAAANYRSDDLELADLDADGDLDLLLAIDEPGQVFWLENPGPAGDPSAVWPNRHLIGRTPAGGGYVKDLEVQDFDGSGRLDIAARTNRQVYVFLQDQSAAWHETLSLAIPDHEGMSWGTSTATATPTCCSTASGSSDPTSQPPPGHGTRSTHAGTSSPAPAGRTTTPSCWWSTSTGTAVRTP